MIPHGPLHGLRIIELAGIGPAPFCGMMLADHGAEVIRIERPGAELDPRNPLLRSRRSITVNLKVAEGVALVRDLAAGADGFMEGFRPGVAERLDLGPAALLSINPRLVYGRMTGWGQTGPYAHAAGHDINYIALSGVLHTVGLDGGRPIPPVNYVGDFGGGGMMLAFAMVSALLAVQRGAPGDVIDCAMTEGSALLAAMTWHHYASGQIVDRPGANVLDGGAHFYNTYECADGTYISLGSIEPQFYALFREKLGVSEDRAFDDPMNRFNWGELKCRVAEIVRRKTRAQWCEAMEASDVCFAPVLSLAEAPKHAHNIARGTFIEIRGSIQPAPAPRYAGRQLPQPRPPNSADTQSEAILASFHIEPSRIEALRATGALL